MALIIICVVLIIIGTPLLLLYCYVLDILLIEAVNMFIDWIEKNENTK